MFELKACVPKNYMFVYNIRNDKSFRETCINKDPISLKDHRKFFMTHYQEFQLVIFDHVPVGYIRTDEQRFVSVNVLPQFRGQGLGSSALSHTHGKAIIRCENLIALHNSLKAGFKMVGFYLEKE